MSVFKDFGGLEKLGKIQGLSRTDKSPIIHTHNTVILYSHYTG